MIGSQRPQTLVPGTPGRSPVSKTLALAARLARLDPPQPCLVAEAGRAASRPSTASPRGFARSRFPHQRMATAQQPGNCYKTLHHLTVCQAALVCRMLRPPRHHARRQTLSRAFSGGARTIARLLFRRSIKIFARDPQQASVGASGDLVPLAHNGANCSSVLAMRIERQRISPKRPHSL